MENGLSRNQIISEIARSSHGDLKQYDPIIGKACSSDPEFLAHLIAWDYVNGQIKDSKVALPVLTLIHREFPDELVENSLAHLALMAPRELLKALKFSIDAKAPARRDRALKGLVRRYLESKEVEPGKWQRLAIRHRRSLKELYCRAHAPRPDWVADALFRGQYATGSAFHDIANLSKMAPAQAAAAIQKWHLSPLVVSGAMAGAKAKQEDSAVVQAGIAQMSDTELTTRAKSLEKKGLSRDAALKETFRKRVAKATKSQKATLKTGVAADEVEDEGIRDMLRELQERQIQAQKDAGRGVEGNWLIIADKSQSQEIAIELGKHIAAAVAKFVTGRVWLAFCDSSTSPAEVTGLSLEQIKNGTRFVRAAGSTSYGIGLAWATHHGIDLDGVAIVGDGGENTEPLFCRAHVEHKQRKGKDLPVYLYKTYCEPRFANTMGGNPNNFAMAMKQFGLSFTEHDLTHGQIDYYSLPNLVQSMNASRFGVVEKIMASPLLTLDQVFKPLVAAHS